MIGEKERICVSTDAAGLFGSTDKITELWPERVNFGREILGWRWLNLEEEMKKNGDKVVGIHGRIGIISGHSKNLILAIMNGFLISSQELIEYGDQADYLLVHEDEARINLGLFIDSAERIRCLMVENSRSNGSVNRTVELVNELREGGLNAGVMFDLYHFYGTLKHDDGVESAWSRTMDKLKDVLRSSENIDRPVGVHLPVGTDKGDALPFEKMTDQMWQQLGGLTNNNQLMVIVIESRQQFPGWLWPMNARGQQERNRIIVETLGRGGVIS